MLDKVTGGKRGLEGVASSEMKDGRRHLLLEAMVAEAWGVVDHVQGTAVDVGLVGLACRMKDTGKWEMGTTSMNR